ncbi:SLATT domain-containing protein [Shewanella sp. D64]|uniref:SLATT domain-containing protein n=1 Tax=unclassified Shewanella TaxID=196818 RepID=UPI0022BA4E3B|nr:MULTISPECIES: SLATT domain-containing protein [unclassified Shewanella]MEC4726549.1 SLATT domain-containing protein [Shewanella sp. D64]MEC4737410.1 SLATT domain-containing protein [Shewanella sp. E94]WBJ97229.1 SLATT domain-containing protein [Shewanella sp. MTB7]
MNTEKVEQLRKRIKNTAYARFFSARRYKKLNKYSLFALTTSSFSLIFISIINKYSATSVISSNSFELYQILSSIFIATLSLIVTLSNYSSKSAEMLKSAEKLNELVSEIELNNSSMTPSLEADIRFDYNTLKSNSTNHEEFEFEYGKTDRKNEEDNKNTYYVDIFNFMKNHFIFASYLAIFIFYLTSCAYILLKYNQTNFICTTMNTTHQIIYYINASR